MKSYPFLTLLARTLLSFPHSTAEVERCFSQLKLTKSERRTNMKSETLEALLLAKYNPPNLENEETFEKAILKYNEVSKVLSQQNKQQNVKRKSSQISPDVTANDEQGRNFLLPKT